MQSLRYEGILPNNFVIFIVMCILWLWLCKYMTLLFFLLELATDCRISAAQKKEVTAFFF